MGTKRHVFDILSVLTLMMLFAFLALSVALMGTSVYSRTNELTRQNSFMRTSALYIQQKLRREDGKISLAKMGDSDAVVITKDYDGEEYCTYIYYYDGYLMEVLSPVSVSPAPENGQRLTELASFSVSADEERDVLFFTLGDPDDGNDKDTFLVNLRSGLTADGRF